MREVVGFNRFLAQRFPYAVYYKVDRDACIVFRVLDCRQSPAKTIKALTKESDPKGSRRMRH
jgi:hypothetical protein